VTARPSERSGLLRLGLPRDPEGSTHLAGFLVAAVATVMLTRALLAATGYPQLGGGGLHVAHVLWGGLLMAVAFVLLLSYAGPAVRPLGALIGGVGFGLFVDEIGKFVTSDNNYFYAPTAALIYAVIVVLLLLGEVLNGRRPHVGVEYLAAAADRAVAGLAGGFTPRARAQARDLLLRAGDARGGQQVAALLDAVEDDGLEVPNPIAAVSGAVVAMTRRLVSARWVATATVAVLLLSSVGSVARGLVAWAGDTAIGWWVIAGMLGGAVVSTGFALAGLVVVRRDRHDGYVLFRRAVLVSLLVTEVFVFRLEQWTAVTGLVVDLLVLGLVAAELDQLASVGTRRPLGARRATGSPEAA
jgi:hypothetical protein